MHNEDSEFDNTPTIASAKAYQARQDSSQLALRLTRARRAIAPSRFEQAFILRYW